MKREIEGQRCPSCLLIVITEKIEREDENGDVKIVKRDLTRHSCPFCGFKIGKYSKFSSDKALLKDHVLNDGFEQKFKYRHMIRNTPLRRYKNEDFRNKHRYIQVYLMKNKGTAYAHWELANVLIEEFGSYRLLTKILRMLYECGLISQREVNGERYYAMR